VGRGETCPEAASAARGSRDISNGIEFRALAPEVQKRKYPSLIILAALVLAAFLAGPPVVPQSPPTPTLTVDEEVVSFAFAPDGRIVYATRHIFNVRRWELERDDFWLVTPDGKRKRIVNGEKLVKSPTPYSYTVQSIRWSPDGTKLTAQLLTDQVIDEKGNTREETLTLLLDDTGKEIKIAGADSVIPEGTNATWLADGVTVGFVFEAVKPKLLFSIGSVRPLAGRGGDAFDRHTFTAVAWDAPHNAAVAIERDSKLSMPPLLVWLDLVAKQRRVLATLDAFLGQLSVSPSGKRVAYFRDQDTLEIREIANPEKIASVQMAYGEYLWSADESRILLKRGSPAVDAPSRRSGGLVWVNLSDGKTEPALAGLTFRDFGLSPDGRFLGVIEPGKRNLLVYPLR